MTDPIEQTDLERHWDALQKFELREQYVQQSANTVAGQPAPFPGSLSLSNVDRVFAKVFG